MAKEQNLFLKRIREKWKADLPILKSVDLDELPKVPKGCNFCCDKYAQARGMFYFVTFDFSPVCRGEFSIGVTVSDSARRSVLDPPKDYRPSPTNVGSYNIAVFLGKRSFRWALVNIEAEISAVLHSVGTSLPLDNVNKWRPSSYCLSIEQIVDEAISDVNERLLKFVFPRLQIQVA